MKKLLLSFLLLLVAFTAPAQQIYQGGGKYSDSAVLMDHYGNNLLPNYQYSIAKGLVAGAKPFEAYGERTTAVAETRYPIWPDGTFVLPPDAGVQMSLVSTSANDTNLTGTGIWSVEIHYLDANLAEQAETVNLNGLTPVLTVATNIRFIQCMHVVGAGSLGGSGAGGVITATNGGNTYSQINTGETRCSSSFRMVPAGYQLRIAAAVGSSTSGTAATSTNIRLVANYIAGHTYKNPLILIPFGSVGVQDNAVSLDFPPGESFPPGTVIGATHTSDKGATIDVTWFGYLEPYP